MLIQYVGGDLLTEIHLGFAIVPQMSLEFDDVEVEMIECGPHAIKPVFRFHKEFVIAVRMRPLLLLLRQRPIASLPTPLIARSTNPAIKDLSIRKIDDIAEL